MLVTLCSRCRNRIFHVTGVQVQVQFVVHAGEYSGCIELTLPEKLNVLQIQYSVLLIEDG